MNRNITGFHKDEIGDWRANLECGHRQHVRHNPPLISRPWVLSEEGRASRIGFELDCKHCDEATDTEDSSGLLPHERD
ncbi:MAG: DUF3565 domain-containing protein [Acidobacteriota bacterium]|nr:DUF3565 domain-containing protein [Acidobacteriota bacterium]